MNKISKKIILAVMAFTFLAVPASALAASVPGQPVDLTYAAEKALTCVVHIKYLQNSKV